MSDHVLIKDQWTSGPQTYHLPSEDDPDEPKCGYKTHDIDWRRMDPDVIPNHRVCDMCENGRNMPSNQGQRLVTKIKNTDPSEVGL